MFGKGGRAYGTIVRPRKRPQAPCLVVRNYRTPVALCVRPAKSTKYLKDHLLDHGRVRRLRGFAGKFLLVNRRIWTKGRG